MYKANVLELILVTLLAAIVRPKPNSTNTNVIGARVKPSVFVQLEEDSEEESPQDSVSAAPLPGITTIFLMLHHLLYRDQHCIYQNSKRQKVP